MNEVSVNVILKNLSIYEEKTSYQTKGTFDISKGLIFFEEDEYNKTKHIFSKEDSRLIMYRENKEMKMSLIFDNDVETKSTYYYKELDLTLDLSVLTDELDFDLDKGYIHVKYYIDLNMENQGYFDLKVNFD